MISGFKDSEEFSKVIGQYRLDCRNLASSINKSSSSLNVNLLFTACSFFVLASFSYSGQSFERSFSSPCASLRDFAESFPGFQSNFPFSAC